MNEYTYDVVITNTGTGKSQRITGELTCVYYEYDTKSIFSCFPKDMSFSLAFNPLTILGDLRNREQPYEYPYERLNIDRSWKCLLGSYQYEYGFGKPIYIGNDVQYLKFVSVLDKIIRNNECKTLYDLDTIRNEYKIELECYISVEDINIYYDLLHKKHKKAEEKTYLPLKYELGKTNDELVNQTYIKKNHKFYYRCHTMSEVIFAILHFSVIHQYEFKTCALCQKRYAKIPNKGQGKYCPRISPLETNLYLTDKDQDKIKGLSCQDAMSKFHEIMRNRKKNKFAGAHTDDNIDSFITEFNEYNDTVKASPIIKNIIELYSFVKGYKFNK